MKSNKQLLDKGIARRSFLLRVSAAVIGVLGSGSILSRLAVKKKPTVSSGAQTIYPKIHSMAVPRENKKA
jgi:hypothetical protein